MREKEKRKKKRFIALGIVLYLVAGFIYIVDCGHSVPFAIQVIISMIVALGLFWFICFIVETIKSDKQRRKDNED